MSERGRKDIASNFRALATVVQDGLGKAAVVTSNESSTSIQLPYWNGDGNVQLLTRKLGGHIMVRLVRLYKKYRDGVRTFTQGIVVLRLQPNDMDSACR